MAKKVILKDQNNVEILPITRGELIVDSSGKEAFHSNEFLATNSQPGLMSPEEKTKLSTMSGNIIDSTLSTTSTNPVQNKVVTVAINEAKQLANDAQETANNASENVSKVQQIINSIKANYLKSATVNGNILTIVDQSDSEITFTNTTYNTFLKETAANTGGRNGLVPKPNYNDGSKTRFLREDGTWIIPTDTKDTAGSTNSTSKLFLIGATSQAANPQTYSNSSVYTTNGTLYATTFVGNLDGTYINKLTGYKIAETIGSIQTTDSLNTALGKLEYKASLGVTAYNLVNAAYDGDGTIENLQEILKVLEGISDTETIKAIIGKYLPLSGGTLGSTSVAETWLNLNSSTARLMISSYRDGTNYIESVNSDDSGNATLNITGRSGRLGSTLNLNFATITTRGSYTNIDSGNYNNYSPSLTGTGASGTWPISITGKAIYLGAATSGVAATSRGDLDSSYALYTGGWASDSLGYATTYGTYIDLSGYSTWYHRLAFNTNGVIEHFMGINTTTLSKVGNLAYTSDIPIVTNYYWANLSVQSSASDTTVPSFGAIRLNGVSSAGTNYITGAAGRIFFGGNFHIDSLGSNKTYINHYTANDVYLCSGSSQGNVGIGTTSPSYKLHVVGDSYTTGWSRASSGFYVEGTGVHFTHKDSVGEIDMTSNNEFLWGSSTGDLFFNYRAVSRGITVTNYIWKAGSSTSYASHTLGALTSIGDQTLYGLTSTCNKGNSTSYMQSALQIREYNFGGAQSDTWAIAPRLSWHWSGRVQTQIGLASNNELYLSKDEFSHAYKLVYETGTWGINITGNAGSSTYPAGFTSRGTSDWSGVAGVLATDWSVNGADIMFKYDGSKLNVITDGRFYQGIDIYGSSKRVLDEYDINHTTWGNADTVDGYHIGDLDFRYARTGYSFISPSDYSMTGSTDLQDWITNMYNQGGYKGYSSITVGSWWWVRSLDFYSPVGTIRTSGAMIIYSGDGNSNKNYKHFLVLDAYSELYGITSNEESWKYYSRFLNNRNYTDFVYSKSTSDNRYLRKDTNDSTPYQYNFTKTDDHAIKVGTIRGTAVGSQTGDFIHLYERVAIGSPNGWGSRNAPTYGLATYGGAWLATDTGNVTIGGTNQLSSVWGSFNLTIGNNTDKVVIGYLNSYTNGVVVGGHNNALSEWAPLNIAGTTLYFRINETIKATINSNGNVGIGTDSPGYKLDIRGTIRSTDRIYANEWIQFDNWSGLYSPNNNAHFYPNNTTSYGQWQLRGSRNGYSGIHFGDSTHYMTIMDNYSDKGVCQQDWDWLWYFNARNGKFSIRTSADFGADINLNGSVRTNSTYYGYGLYHLSYGSSAYALTSDGGAAHIGSMSVYYANSAGRLNLTSCYNGTTNNDLWSTIKTSNSSYIGTATIYEVYNDGGPDTYGEVLDIVSMHSNHWQPQLWFGAGTGGRLRYRNKDYNNNSWGNWYTVAYTSDIPTSLPANGGTSSAVTINYNNDSNSTYQMLWGSGNYVYGTGGIYCNPYTDYLYSGSFYCGNWFRSAGATGWYNESYGGGLYMEDSTWIRIYNNKKFYVANGEASAIHSAGGVYVAGAVHSYANFLKSTCNGKTITIGSANDSFCHYQTDAPSHWFNKTVYVQGNVYGGDSYNRRLAYVDELPTNTWRGIVDNLTSTSTTESLTANMGRVLANGKSDLPVVLLAGTLYRASAGTTAIWHFTGIRHRSVSTTDPSIYVSGGVARFDFTANSGYSFSIYGVCVNHQASGETPNYTSTEYSVRGAGFFWFGAYASGRSVYIRAICQGNSNNDSSYSNAPLWNSYGDGVTRMQIIAIGYAY